MRASHIEINVRSDWVSYYFCEVIMRPGAPMLLCPGK